MNLVTARRAAVALVAAFVVSCTASTPAATSPAPIGITSQTTTDPTAGTFFLVRHAEKADDGTDPALTAEGHERAARLARRLASEKIARVLSTDYRRTRDTAAPTAAAFGLEVEIYDPRDLPGLAARLRAEGGRILIVGHSNSTPALVTLLGGDPGAPIAETEYDRVYRMEMPSGKTTITKY